MIYRLRGTVVQVDEEMAVIDVGGVGYGVFMPARLLGAQVRHGLEMDIHTLTIVSQDDIRLFGFLGTMDREFFRLLLNIPRLGPKGAMKVLSHAPAVQLINNVLRGDVKALTKIPGVGKKVATRIVMELQEKVKNLVGEVDELDDTYLELVEVLTGLGSTPGEVSRVVEQVRQRLADGPMDFDRALSEALSIMAQGDENLE